MSDPENELQPLLVINNNKISENDESLDTVLAYEELKNKNLSSTTETNEVCISIQENVTVKNRKDSNQKPGRVLWVDCLRIYACFLVIWTHCSWFFVKKKFHTKNWYVLTTYRGLSRACVPYFVIISGMFFLNPEKKLSYRKIYTKYVWRIFKSFIFWGLFHAIVFKRFLHNDISLRFIKVNPKKTINDFIQGKEHMWYLNFVMGLYILTPIYRAIAKDRAATIYIMVVSSILSQLFPTLRYVLRDICKFENVEVFTNFTASLRMELVGSFTVYYLLGHVSTWHTIRKKKYLYLSYLVGFVGLIMTPVLHILQNRGRDSEIRKFYDYYAFNVVMTSVGGFIFFKYEVTKWLNPLFKKKWFVKIVLTLSDCSFGIYLSHFSLAKFLSIMGLHAATFEPLFFLPIQTVIVFITTFIVVYFLRKIPLFRQIT
jgi:surface polysaccharide O-acyltransferase-like enzyme